MFSTITCRTSSSSPSTRETFAASAWSEEEAAAPPAPLSAADEKLSISSFSTAANWLFMAYASAVSPFSAYVALHRDCTASRKACAATCSVRESAMQRNARPALITQWKECDVSYE